MCQTKIIAPLLHVMLCTIPLSEKTSEIYYVCEKSHSLSFLSLNYNENFFRSRDPNRLLVGVMGNLQLLECSLVCLRGRVVDEKINTYHKPKRIVPIIDALDLEEVDFLRYTTFETIILQAENHLSSENFCQFVVVRMLRVKKKYEIWGKWFPRRRRRRRRTRRSEG